MKATYYLRLFTLLLLLPLYANAQTWSDMFNNQGFNGQVLSLYADTPNNVLYAGGQFTTVDGTTVNGIAKWDGTRWNAMGDGFGGSRPYVFWITKYKNDIYAAGSFSASGTDSMHGIAKWNGTKWEKIGGDLKFTTQNEYIAAMHEFNNELYVGGNFDTIGTNAIKNVAKWDGTKWSAVGTETDDVVLVINSHNNELYIGGYFVFAAPSGFQYRIAKLNGNKFETVGSKGLGDATQRWVVETLATYKGKLYAGGAFNVLESGTTQANHVAIWDGTKWSAAGAGVVGLNPPAIVPVRTMVVYNGLLYAGGGFVNAGQKSAYNIATWDGATWDNVHLGTNDVINAMAIYDGNIIMGGNFTTAGGQTHKYIVKFKPTTSVGKVKQEKVFTLYPNPVTNGSFTISTRDAAKDLNYKLYNLKGQQIAKGAVPLNGIISLAKKLPTGNYIINITSNQKDYGQQQISIKQ